MVTVPAMVWRGGPIGRGVAVGAALWDAALGSMGSAVASFIYLGLITLEVLCWPGQRARLLANTDRAAGLALFDGESGLRD